jgi:hypothetical protein
MPLQLHDIDSLGLSVNLASSTSILLLGAFIVKGIKSAKDSVLCND